MSRLLEPPANYPQWPVHYLLGCYERASQQLRQAGQLKDKTFSARLQQALAEIKDLAVRYTGLLLTVDGSMFEQVCCVFKPCMHCSHLDLSISIEQVRRHCVSRTIHGCTLTQLHGLHACIHQHASSFPGAGMPSPSLWPLPDAIMIGQATSCL